MALDKLDTDMMDTEDRINLKSGRKNYIINGGFDVWQRATTIDNPTTANEYNTVDRFRFRRASNATGIRIAQNSLTETGLQSLYVARISGDTNTDQFFMRHQIESKSAARLKGKDIVMSVRVRVGSAFSAASINTRIVSGTGINESCSIADGSFTTGNFVINSDSVGIDISLKSQWQTAVFTGTVPDDATEISIGFSWAPTGTAANAEDSLRFGYIQLEEGTEATDFEHRPYAEELALCQRYYWQGQDAGQGNGHHYGAAGDTLMLTSSTTLPVTLRAVPTLSVLTAPVYVNCSTINMVPDVSGTGFVTRVNVTATGKYRATLGVYSADAEL